jgi:hypothetical protein
LTTDGEIGRPLNNLITRMPEFEHFTAESAQRWTLPMAAAWFIWRNLAAVNDQWKIVTGAWTPAFDPPIFILSHHLRQPGTLTCVFQQAGFACGKRPYVRLKDIRDPPPTETKDPYERLRVALQTGRLRTTIVEDSPDEGNLTESEWGKDDWLDFDNLADPASDAPPEFLSDPAKHAVLVSAEDVMSVEVELSMREAERPVWKLEQVLGWIAYRRDETFRSLGRIDLEPPTFFGHSYNSDWVESQPLMRLTAKLLSTKVPAYVDGVRLTRADCISMLSKSDGIWRKDNLTFSPEEIRANWSRVRQGTQRTTSGAEDRALKALKAHLMELGERREKRQDTKAWILARHPLLSRKDGFNRIWKKARADPAIGPAKIGAPPKSASVRTAPRNPNLKTVP